MPDPREDRPHEPRLHVEQLSRNWRWNLHVDVVDGLKAFAPVGVAPGGRCGGAQPRELPDRRPHRRRAVDAEQVVVNSVSRIIEAVLPDDVTARRVPTKVDVGMTDWLLTDAQ